MDPSQILHEPWLDRLLVESDPDKRIRLSLDACLSIVDVLGVGFWVESAGNRFVCQRELGLTEDGPSPEVIQKVAQGEWETRQAKHEVLVVGCAPKRMAWSLTLPIVREEALDSLEAFLFLVCTLHVDLPDADTDGPSLLPSDA